MRTRWYQKATVQAAIIAGAFLVIVAIIGIIPPLLEKKEKNEKQRVGEPSATDSTKSELSESKTVVENDAEVIPELETKSDFVSITFEEYHKNLIL